MEEELAAFIKNMTQLDNNGAAEIFSTKMTKSVPTVLGETITGLLAQKSLTKAQVDLLALLLDSWTKLTLGGKS